MSLGKRVVFALMGTAAAGVAVGAFYYYHTKQQQSPDIVQLESEVEETHVTWLQGVASKYTDGDAVKALQKLIDHCKVVSDDNEGAEKVFKKIRCKSCGNKKKVPFTANVTPDQRSFIDGAVEQHEINGGQSKTLRIMFEYAINDAEESVVFAG